MTTLVDGFERRRKILFDNGFWHNKMRKLWSRDSPPASMTDDEVYTLTKEEFNKRISKEIEASDGFN